MDKKIYENILIRNSMGCYYRNILEQNTEYTIAYCTFYSKEISSHGNDCIHCKNNPYFLNIKQQEKNYD